MDFSNFGVVSFTKQAKVAKFVDNIVAGKLTGTQCKKCGRKYFPPRADCAYCINSEIEWFEIKGPGKLLTFTEVQYGPLGFEAEQPYVLGMVQFPEGVRVTAKISKKIAVNDIRIGMELRPASAKIGDEKYNFEFVK